MKCGVIHSRVPFLFFLRWLVILCISARANQLSRSSKRTVQEARTGETYQDIAKTKKALQTCPTSFVTSVPAGRVHFESCAACQSTM